MDPSEKKWDFQPAWWLKNLPWILLYVDVAVVLVLWATKGNLVLALVGGAILALASWVGRYALKKEYGGKTP